MHQFIKSFKIKSLSFAKKTIHCQNMVFWSITEFLCISKYPVFFLRFSCFYFQLIMELETLLWHDEYYHHILKYIFDHIYWMENEWHLGEMAVEAMYFTFFSFFKFSKNFRELKFSSRSISKNVTLHYSKSIQNEFLKPVYFECLYKRTES